MQEQQRHQIWLTIISAAIFLTSLQSTSLWDQDEGYFASTAAEMHARGDWIVPIYNGEMFGHKPPFMYWMMMLGYELFGTTEFAARFFTGVFGVATTLLTYHLARHLFNAKVGWWAGLILASGLMFSVASRAATPDTYLTFFATLSLYLFAVSGPFNKKLDEPSTEETNRSHLPSRWKDFAIIYAVMGLATLVKGPIGFFFPMAVIGLYLLCMTPIRNIESTKFWRRTFEALKPFGPVNFLKTVWRMRIFTAIAAILLVAGPWFVVVGMKTNGAFLNEFFGVHHFNRFSTPMDSHQGPVVYYLASILVGMFPWSIFAIPSVMLVIQHIHKKAAQYPALIFMSCWAGVYVGIFSLASTKLPNYILPAYPALAVLFGYFFHYWIENPAKVHQAWPRIALFFLPLVGLGAMIGLPLAGTLQISGETLLDRVGLATNVQSHLIWTGLVGLPAVIGGGLAYLYNEKNKVPQAMQIYSIASVLTLLGVWNYATPQIASYQICNQLGSAVHKHAPEQNAQVATYGFFQPSLAFYVTEKITRMPDAETAHAFLNDKDSLLIISSKRFNELSEAGLQPVEVVEEFQRFPERGTIMVVRPLKGSVKLATEAREASPL